MQDRDTVSLRVPVKILLHTTPHSFENYSFLDKRTWNRNWWPHFKLLTHKLQLPRTSVNYAVMFIPVCLWFHFPIYYSHRNKWFHFSSLHSRWSIAPGSYGIYMLISPAAAHAITSPIHLFPVVILDYTFLEQITVITGGGQAVLCYQCPWINLLIAGEMHFPNKFLVWFTFAATFLCWKSPDISDSKERQFKLCKQHEEMLLEVKYSTGTIWNSKLRNWVAFLGHLIQFPLKTKLLSLWAGAL